MKHFSKIRTSLLFIALAAILCCRAPTTDELSWNRPFEEKLNQYWPFSNNIGMKVKTKAEAIRLVHCALSLKGVTFYSHILSSVPRWTEALARVFEAMPYEMPQYAKAQQKIDDSLFEMKYRRKDRIEKASEIIPADISKLLLIFANAIGESVPPDIHLNPEVR